MSNSDIERLLQGSLAQLQSTWDAHHSNLLLSERP